MTDLSIITINYNNDVGLQKTLKSVSNQSCKSFGHVVVDGGSVDSSVDTIKAYVADNGGTYDIKWVSERDGGIYNAMNKGIRLSKGRFLLFINSGDLIYDESVVERLMPYLMDSFDVLSGQLQYVNGNEVSLWNPPEIVNLDYCVKTGLTHPNTVINRNLFEKYGFYNEKNKIVSDWEFFLVACGLNSAIYKPIPFPIAVFYADGISTVESRLCIEEKKRVLKRLLPLKLKIKYFIVGLKKRLLRSPLP
jgi:glycosyltransferase involved in cell wall biosynthesis